MRGDDKEGWYEREIIVSFGIVMEASTDHSYSIKGKSTRLVHHLSFHFLLMQIEI